MNRTALSVIALAVGSVLIIGLFNIYKPQTKGLVDKVFHKVQVNNLDEHKWGSLYYLDDHNGNIEFTRGTLKSSKSQMFANANVPDIRKAKSIKFDNVNTSHVNDLHWMFAGDWYLKSVDLGDNFNPGNVQTQGDEHNSINHNNWGLSSMFQGDPNLEHVNFGSDFKLHGPVNLWKLENMFSQTPKLQQPTGNVPKEVQEAYNGRLNDYFPGIPR